MMQKNIGFVSTRFDGTDGVSLESSKWSRVLAQDGHTIFWFAGQLDREPRYSFPVPEAHFQHPANERITRQAIGRTRRSEALTEEIHSQRAFLKAKLHQFVKMFGIDMLIVENALSLPMHIPLGLALTETIAETQIPTIAHHHDFYWERSRYAVNAIGDYLHMAFPPSLPNMIHAVINSTAREELALRTGTTSYLVPNVMDFDIPLSISKDRCLQFRQSMGLDIKDILILQPTRIVQRKGIEHAINLVKALGDSCCKLVISHEAGDEGYAYAAWLEQYAKDQGVDLRLVPTRLCDPWRPGNNGSSPFSLWEIYASSDFVTFPSLNEGFGNAFLEAIYFKKPLLVNRYCAFIKDIEPLGFDLITMDGYLGAETVHQVSHLLGSTSRRSTMVGHNFEVARRYFSYNTLRGQLKMMFAELLGQPFVSMSHPAADNLVHLQRAHLTVQPSTTMRPVANLF